MTVRPVLGTLLFLLLTGCGSEPSGPAAPGSSSGSTSGSGGPATSGGSSGQPAAGSPTGDPTPCVDTRSAVALGDKTALGFAPAELLAKVGGTQELSLEWLTVAAANATHTRAGTETSLTLAFDDASAQASYVDSVGGGCPRSGEAPCIVCTSRLEIAIDLKLTSGDGALADSTRVTLSTTSLSTATVTAELAAASLAGSYLEGITPDADYEATGIHLEAAYAASFAGSHAVVPDAWNGFVAANLRSTKTPTALTTYAAHGYFPPATAP